MKKLLVAFLAAALFIGAVGCKKAEEKKGTGTGTGTPTKEKEKEKETK